MTEQETRMTGRAKAKGDRAEREAAGLLSRLLGLDVRRLLGAGRRDDVGDLDLPGWAIQVADWDSLARALNVKPRDAEEQAKASGLPYAAAMLRLRGGTYRVCMTPEMFARLWAATQPETPPAKPTLNGHLKVDPRWDETTLPIEQP